MGTLLFVLVVLSVIVALLLGSVDESLPDIPGLDYRTVQVGLVALALGTTAYTIDRERGIRRLEKELVEERLEVEKLQVREEMKNALLRTVSHDLRTPLTAILAGATILEQKGEELPADQLREAASIVRAQAHRLEGMLSDLLDMERLETGTVRLKSEQIRVDEFVPQVVADLAVAERPVELTVSEGEFVGDPSMLGRILDNLVLNATKYTPVGTPIHVEASLVDSTLVLSVADRGPGVPDHLKELIFLPFERGEPPEGIAGTGVGLSLVRSFAELHGGRAWVEDAPGGGARFVVHLAPAS